MIILAY